MAGRVKDAEVSVWCRKMLRGDLDSDTALLLLFCLIHEVSKFETSLSVDFSFALISLKLMFRVCAGLVQNLPTQCALAAINMTNDDQVQVVLLFFGSLNQLVINHVLNLGVRCIQFFFVYVCDLDLWLSRARGDYLL